jgi:TonB family protein
MTKLIFMMGVALALLGIAEPGPGNAQGRRHRTSSPSATPKVSSVREFDAGTPEERARIIEECSIADRPKPEVEIGRNSDALLCGKAVSLPTPAYPANAKAQHIFGAVSVNVVIDEKGRVIWARVMDGPPLLQDAAAKAACRARYTPIKISNRAVKANGIITYNFVDQ